MWSLSFYINYIQTSFIAYKSTVCQLMYTLLFLSFNRWQNNIHTLCVIKAQQQTSLSPDKVSNHRYCLDLTTNSSDLIQDETVVSVNNIIKIHHLK